ncbi:hypothetical protein [Chryseobacterium populi]|uniref:Uncharacterized protein n=1 Tax=Chryseobacterium populi TaxID=1144316 RepID=J2T6X9_9FLAO|nr:hypothetical protein [Chryseobacterium populi]EJL73812.1 hypothetical protein PMI13_01385 [Chryseobacterium populi]
MSKRKQLIHDVFERIKETSEKDTKYGWSEDLADAIEKKIKFKISVKTLSRYYEAYIDGINEEKGIETLILNRLSQYLGFDDYEDFCTTIEKKGETASKTTVKIGVDNEEVSSVNGIPNVNVTINNTNSNNNDQHFNMPEFIKKNGLGILEMAFVLLLVTGGVVLPNTKNDSKGGKNSSIVTLWGKSDVDKKYMYWNGERYIATDSSDLGPQLEIVPMHKYNFKYLKKIMRPDTLTADNGLGKVWYDKSNNNVEFFTSPGIHPENGKALKDVSETILNNHAGIQTDSLQTEE